MRLRIRTVPREGAAGEYMSDFPCGQDVVVEDAETGEPLEGVQAATWSLENPFDPVTATIRLLGVDIDAEVDACHVTGSRTSGAPDRPC